MNETAKKRAALPRPLRITAIIVGALVAVAIMVGGGTAAFSAAVAPAAAKATMAGCHHDFTSPIARKDCAAGERTTATKAEKAFKATKKAQAIADECASTYSDALAVSQCTDGDAAAAVTSQKAADEATAAAEKKATEGQTADNPSPVGAKASMQSTNRIDGSVVTYTEWASGFTADWRGYDEFDAPDTGMKYVAYTVHVQATDAGVDAGSVGYDASFTDQKGNVYSQATVTYEAKPQMPQATLGAGQQASGVVVFEVPASASAGVATIGDGSTFLALR